MRATRGVWRCAVLGCGIWLCACNLVLGIKDLKSEAAPDGGKSDGGEKARDGGVGKADGGAAGKGGNAGNGGSGGAGGHAGAAAMDASTKGDGGAAGSGGAGSGGAGSGGNDAATHDAATQDAGHDAGSAHGLHVQGKVIDYWGHALPGVTAAIGATTVTTDSNGAFTIDDVAAPYDVALTISTTRSNSPAKFAWRFEGLTRTDPTLQVYRGLGERDANHVNPHVSNAFPLTSSQKITMDFASPDGEFNLDLTSQDADYISAAWVGPMITTGAAHALFWSFSGAHDLPTSYLAHDGHTIAIDETAASNNIAFDLNPSSPFTSAMISGTVTSPTTNSRNNLVFVHFDDGAAIQVVTDSVTQSAFSYVVPSGLSSSTIVVAASEGYSSSSPPFAIAHSSVAPGQTGITLAIPTPPSVVSPGAGASGIDGTTAFVWTGSATVFVFYALSVPTYDAFFVVTSKKQTTLPTYPASALALAANTSFSWGVETHGSFATVDDAAGATGFIDSLASGTLRGPGSGDGVYAESEERTFTSKP